MGPSWKYAKWKKPEINDYIFNHSICMKFPDQANLERQKWLSRSREEVWGWSLKSMGVGGLLLRWWKRSQMNYKDSCATVNILKATALYMCYMYLNKNAAKSHKLIPCIWNIQKRQPYRTESRSVVPRDVGTLSYGDRVSFSDDENIL
jgi:hypothetical protein